MTCHYHMVKDGNGAVWVGFRPSRPVKIPVSKKPVYRPVPPVLTGTRLTRLDSVVFFSLEKLFQLYIFTQNFTWLLEWAYNMQ